MHMTDNNPHLPVSRHNASQTRPFSTAMHINMHIIQQAQMPSSTCPQALPILSSRAETPVRVPDERDHHLRRVVLAQLLRLRLPGGARVRLVDVVDGEVLGVDVGAQARLEGRAHVADALPLHAGEVGVGLDLGGAGAAAGVPEALLGVAEEPGRTVSLAKRAGMGGGGGGITV